MSVKIEEKHLMMNGMIAIINPLRISLFNSQGRKDFVFQNSKPEVVEQVAQMLLKAVAISKKQNKTEFGINVTTKRKARVN